MDINGVKEVIVDTFKKNWKALAAMTFNIFAVIVIFVALDAFLLSGLIILGYIAVILPFYISLIITNIKFKVDNTFTGKEFYMNYKLALIPGLSSSLRSIRSFFISFLFFWVSTLLVYYIATSFDFINASDFMNLLNADKSNYTEYLANLQSYIGDTSNGFIRFMFLLITSTFGASTFLFIFLILRNTPLFYVQSNFACTKAEAIKIQKNTSLKIRKLYRKILYSNIWPAFVLFPIGYASGVAIMTIYSFNLSLLILAGTIGGLLLSIIFLPIFVCSEDILFSVFMPYYLLEARDVIISTLKRINQDVTIPNEEKDIIRKFYVDRLKQIDLMNEANPNPNSVNDDQNHINDVTNDINLDSTNTKKSEENNDSSEEKKEDLDLKSKHDKDKEE